VKLLLRRAGADVSAHDNRARTPPTWRAEEGAIAPRLELLRTKCFLKMPERYDKVAITLHWVVRRWCCGQISLGWSMIDIPKNRPACAPDGSTCTSRSA